MVDLTVIAIIGIVLLIGIVKKNAIMMVDFAPEAESSEGKSPLDAIHEACLLRFRPIMMTTMAALLGGLPLAFGWGAGWNCAAARHRHCRRSARIASADFVHDASDLSLPRTHAPTDEQTQSFTAGGCRRARRIAGGVLR